MKTIKLPGKLAGDIHWGEPEPVAFEDTFFVEESWIHWDRSRWSQIFQFVIKRSTDSGSTTYWLALIERGSTENQDQCDFRDREFIKFHQVDKVPTVTYKYVAIQ